MEVNVREDLKKPITHEEHERRMAIFHKVTRELEIANQESPLPDDIMDAVYGHKYEGTASSQTATAF
jgi:hypothetical protein